MLIRNIGKLYIDSADILEQNRGIGWFHRLKPYIDQPLIHVILLSMKADLAEMQNYLHEHIPITANLGVEVTAFARGAIHLRAPLAANINHRDTAFGGSLSAIGILAGWALIHFSLQQAGLASRIVIQRSNTAFLAPGDEDFEAVARLPDSATWERFCTALKKWGRARLTLPSEVSTGKNRIAAHEGVYVAFLNERL